MQSIGKGKLPKNGNGTQSNGTSGHSKDTKCPNAADERCRRKRTVRKEHPR